LDGYVGAVNGIGVGLFAYLRMRAGSDALKPDRRLRMNLSNLGFRIPRTDVDLILVGEGAAEELGVSRLYLDQLLW
jgi:glycerate kinase